MRLVIAAQVDGSLYRPLECADRRWEWFCDDTGCADTAPYILPYDLFIRLPGYDPNRFAVSFETFEEAADALRVAFDRKMEGPTP